MKAFGTIKAKTWPLIQFEYYPIISVDARTLKLISNFLAVKALMLNNHQSAKSFVKD
jgi:hypothetical protein